MLIYFAPTLHVSILIEVKAKKNLPDLAILPKQGLP